MTKYSHRGGAVPTELVQAISDVQVGDVILDSATGWPDGSGGPFFGVIDRGLSTEEKVLFLDRSGTTLTLLQRAADDTLAWPHGQGASVEHVFTAVEAEDANVHREAASGVHGVASGEVIASETYVLSQISAAHPQTYSDDELTVGGDTDPSLVTAIHGLPYPDGTDPLLVRRALEMLAEALDLKVPFILSGTSEPPEPASDYPEGTIYMRTEA